MKNRKLDKHRKLNNHCIDCDKEIDDRSIRCYSCAKTGKRSPSYKDGLSRVGGLRIEYSRRNNWREFTVNSAKWVKNVFERDNYKCQHCNNDKKLRAHHIYSYAKYPKLRLQLENGITLCNYHHKQLHQLFGNDVTPEQLKWFFNHVK